MLLPDSREMEKQTPRWQTWGGLGDSFLEMEREEWGKLIWEGRTNLRLCIQL